MFFADICGRLRPVSGVIVQRRDRFLVVKKDRKNHAWQFPQGGVEKGELHIEAADRELNEECGTDLVVQFNPQKQGVFRYFFPPNFRRGSYQGAAVAMFRAHYKKGDIRLNPKELIDYAWITREQMSDYFSPEYNRFVQKILRKS